MAPLPSAPTRIYCLACLLHDQGLNGYTVSSYQQNHGPKCKKIIPFYGFYCKHLLDNNLTATPFGDIPPEYQHFMELPRDDEIATDSSVGSLVGLVLREPDFSRPSKISERAYVQFVPYQLCEQRIKIFLPNDKIKKETSR